QGAFFPPKLPASAAHRFGSISLWGGAISNCAYPQKVSDGKNMRSAGFDWPQEPTHNAKPATRRQPALITQSLLLEIERLNRVSIRVRHYIAAATAEACLSSKNHNAGCESPTCWREVNI